MLSLPKANPHLFAIRQLLRTQRCTQNARQLAASRLPKSCNATYWRLELAPEAMLRRFAAAPAPARTSNACRGAAAPGVPGRFDACRQHGQAIIVSIDQYAEKAFGKRDYFLNRPPGFRGRSDQIPRSASSGSMAPANTASWPSPTSESKI
ncbi:hypothetical protein FXV83_30425 [Bradyrhizobium hipponense]|uniref:Uncharacterized protein n=1 Tax=Bradyrhizobium hipponense TaxID=2605638 RepID=A0A5S4YRD3_9BRAD|nr:hypothetical protein FXV83_30425 [Bradyrhizobium hipponense]